ncbi:hypothetical protein [Dyella sp. 2HG41-7]|uniref:hypothetical protein n=1 Tax=Dyella sp. 2HG41-7 TaxID=2883239 RepID=UPI001F3D069D|nr:hypothetical protein [Dyella sp. 2HG41-7]
MQTAGNGNPADAGAPPPTTESAGSYFAQHFTFDALNADVKDAITRANLAPVSFNQIVMHTRDQVITEGQAQPATYSSIVTLENAGHGLVRSLQIVQDNGANVATQLGLTYRGYFSFLTQSVSARADKVPPVQGPRKILKFDTGTSAHAAFVYLYGDPGKDAFPDPGQFLCDSGKTYNAAQLSPAIEGQAQEMNCRAIDSNGMETEKVTFAYLEKYGVAVTLRVHNDQRTIDTNILDFNVR